MTVMLTVLLAVAGCLIFGPSTGAGSRLSRTLGPSAGRSAVTGSLGGGRRGAGLPWGSRLSRGAGILRVVSLGRGGPRPQMWARQRALFAARRPEPLKLTVLVEQLAALLRGGRTAVRLWEELYLVHGEDDAISGRPRAGARGSPAAQCLGWLSAGSLEVLLAVRSAAMIGASPADTIRTASSRALPGDGNKERRIWGELAACFDVAETSGCPLADVLSRFACQLEAEDDAEAARQTALAGPKATVSLLSWLPLLGLGLGTFLGIDPLTVLLGSPLGAVALAVGLALALAGRVWSSRLVRAAAGT